MSDIVLAGQDADTWRETMVYRYIKEYAPQLLRPGIVFTPEQEAQIRALAGDGSIDEAREIILAKLREEVAPSPDTFEILAREMVSGSPYTEDDYGCVYCFFCYSDEDKPHDAAFCVWERAKRLIEAIP